MSVQLCSSWPHIHYCAYLNIENLLLFSWENIFVEKLLHKFSFLGYRGYATKLIHKILDRFCSFFVMFFTKFGQRLAKNIGKRRYY